MKLLAMVLLLPMAAYAVTVEPLPPSGYADTEVSTNIAFDVERPAMTRIEFTVALDATPTNNVEVTRRGCGAACELVKAEGKLPGFKLEVR